MKWDIQYDERVSKDVQDIGGKELSRIKNKIEWLSEHCDAYAYFVSNSSSSIG